MNHNRNRTRRLLSISHSSVVAGYQDRFSEIARQSGMEITLLVPERWRQFNRMVVLEKMSDPGYRIVARQPFCWGLKNHGLRNVTHIYPGMEKLIEEVKPDIIELWEEPFSAVTAQTVHAARRVAPHARIIFFSARNIRKRYPPPFSWFEQYTYRHADFAFIMNREADEITREYGWRKASSILPLGVNPEHFKKLDASGRRNELGLKKFTVGFIGKFDEQKGILDLIKGSAPLKDDINLLLIGSGPLRAEMERLIQSSGLTGEATILDAVSYRELPSYLNCMDLLVLPSITLPGLKEQFGRVLIEAMSCGVPVIGSDSGEIPKVIGNAGLTFPEGDINALTERINSLRENPAQAGALAEQGRSLAENMYSWSAIARQQIKVYEELMKNT